MAEENKIQFRSSQKVVIRDIEGLNTNVGQALPDNKGMPANLNAPLTPPSPSRDRMPADPVRGDKHILRHAEESLLSISTVFKKQGRDPEQKHLRMTLLSNTANAFTLIELLVVVLIIGILASIALPQYQKIIDKANFVRADAAARALVKHLEWYYLEHGVYPTDWTKIDFSYPGCTVKGGSVTCDDIKAGGETVQLILSVNKEFIYFTTANFFRNYYYLLHTQQAHRGEWECRAVGTGVRGGKLCRSICGTNNCYYR